MTERFDLHLENLKRIFYPKSVAVVGTTRVKGTVPYDIFENMLTAGLNAALYPVNPKEKFIASVRTYKYVVDIPDTVDLAVIVYPSSVCHMALEQCGQKGIRSVIIISAGFREVGPAGIERENRLKDIARQYGISFIGPNCLGVINTDPEAMLNASFARKMPEEGSIGFLSQSGALCTAVLDYARAKHIGFSKFISFGNKADISEIDLLYYLKNDEKTKVILLYLEEVSDGRALMEVCSEIIHDTGKPILILKSGRTSEGASAAASHTGSLAGSDEICGAAFAQAGIIRCNDIEEMFNRAIAMAYQPLPKSNRVAIITNAGGPGVLTTDATIREGLRMARFSEETTAILKKYLPNTANIKNPVDVIGDARADRYNAAMTAAFADPDVAGVFVILTPQSMTDIETIAQEIVTVSKTSDKPVYTSFMGEYDVAGGIDILQRNRIPHYILPESMCHSFAAAWQMAQTLQAQRDVPELLQGADRSAVMSRLSSARSKGVNYLTEQEADFILRSYGIRVPDHGLARSEQEALELAAGIGYPVVMKVMSHDIVHKFDVHGVVLNINSPEEVKMAYKTITDNVARYKPDARIEGMYVGRMIRNGFEVIVGAKQDPSFGTVVMFGLGGLFVEIFRDVSFGIAPISRQAALRMVRNVRSHPLLSGVRGTEVRDVEALCDSIIRVGQLCMDCPDIRELDINPLLVLPEGQGCFAVDSRIML
jgi:acetate---CoA ligase (ADP-forming)